MKKSIKNIILIAIEKSLLTNEEVNAVTQKHGFCALSWWLNPFHLIFGVFSLGLLFFYKSHLIKNEVIIITNKRLIGSVSPKLFTKDKIELTLKGIDNIIEDETILGNLFGWTSVEIQTRAGHYQQRMVTKDSVRELKNSFYEMPGS